MWFYLSLTNSSSWTISYNQKKCPKIERFSLSIKMKLQTYWPLSVKKWNESLKGNWFLIKKWMPSSKAISSPTFLQCNMQYPPRFLLTWTFHLFLPCPLYQHAFYFSDISALSHHRWANKFRDIKWSALKQSHQRYAFEREKKCNVHFQNF